MVFLVAILDRLMKTFWNIKQMFVLILSDIW